MLFSDNDPAIVVSPASACGDILVRVAALVSQLLQQRFCFFERGQVLALEVLNEGNSMTSRSSASRITTETSPSHTHTAGVVRP